MSGNTNITSIVNLFQSDIIEITGENVNINSQVENVFNSNNIESDLTSDNLTIVGNTSVTGITRLNGKVYLNGTDLEELQENSSSYGTTTVYNGKIYDTNNVISFKKDGDTEVPNNLIDIGSLTALTGFIDGDVTISGSLNVKKGDINISDSELITEKDVDDKLSDINASIRAISYISGSDTTLISNNTNITGNLNVSGITTVESLVVNDENIDIHGDTNITGNINCNGNIITNNLQVDGTAIISGIINTNELIVDSTLNIEEDIYVIGNTNLSGNLESTGDIKVNNLSVDGNTSISGITSISGNTIISGELNILGSISSVSGDSTVNFLTQDNLENVLGNGISLQSEDDLIINSNTLISGDLNITGNILPARDNMYNLGSSTARWKELFISDNSIWLGDKHKIGTNRNNEMKLRKRRMSNNYIPKFIRNKLNEQSKNNDQVVNDLITKVKSYRNIDNYNDINLDDWLKLSKDIVEDSNKSDPIILSIDNYNQNAVDTEDEITLDIIYESDEDFSDDEIEISGQMLTPGDTKTYLNLPEKYGKSRTLAYSKKESAIYFATRDTEKPFIGKIDIENKITPILDITGLTEITGIKHMDIYPKDDQDPNIALVVSKSNNKLQRINIAQKTIDNIIIDSDIVINNPKHIIIDNLNEGYLSADNSIYKIQFNPSIESSTNISCTITDISDKFSNNNVNELNNPDGIVIYGNTDISGSNKKIIIADTGNHCIRSCNINSDNLDIKINGESGISGNTATTGNRDIVKFKFPNKLTIDTNGKIYILDQLNTSIKSIEGMFSDNYKINELLVRDSRDVTDLVMKDDDTLYIDDNEYDNITKINEVNLKKDTSRKKGLITGKQISNITKGKFKQINTEHLCVKNDIVIGGTIHCDNIEIVGENNIIEKLNSEWKNLYEVYKVIIDELTNSNHISGYTDVTEYKSKLKILLNDLIDQSNTKDDLNKDINE